uniref:Uncharacterized protein n=1 Tax=Oryza meridionalis TaxID=40149 RepID=A0A0E0EB74_9ORYZ
MRPSALTQVGVAISPRAKDEEIWSHGWIGTGPRGKQKQLRTFNMGKHELEAPIPTVKDHVSSQDHLKNIEMANSELLGNKTDKPSGPLEMLPKLNLSMGTPAPVSPPMRFGNGGCHIDLNDQPPVEQKLADEAVKISGEEKMLIKADMEYPTPVSSPRSFGTGGCGCDLNEMPEEIDEP